MTLNIFQEASFNVLIYEFSYNILMAIQRRNDVPPSLNNTLSTTLQRHDAHRHWYDIASMQWVLFMPNGIFFPYKLDELF